MATQERSRRGEVRLSSVVCICILSVSIEALYPSHSLESALFTEVYGVAEATKIEVTVLSCPVIRVRTTAAFYGHLTTHRILLRLHHYRRLPEAVQTLETVC